jgi:chaperonin GroEL (HSP60 family)
MVCRKTHLLLQNMSIGHPAAALVSRMSQSLFRAVGDGSSSAVLLCASLVAEGNALMRAGMPMATVCRTMERVACEAEQMLLTRSHQVNFMEQPAEFQRVLRAVVLSCSATKASVDLVTPFADALASVVAELMSASSPLQASQFDMLFDVVMLPSLSQRLEVVSGVRSSHAWMSVSEDILIENARVVFSTDSLEASDGQRVLEFHSAEERIRLSQMERSKSAAQINALVAAGCNILVLSSKPQPHIIDELHRAGILVLFSVSKRDFYRWMYLADSKQAFVRLPLTADPLSSACGQWTSCSITFRHGRPVVCIEGRNRAFSICVFGSTVQARFALQVAARDGLNATRLFVAENGRYVDGAGQVDMQLAQMAMDHANTERCAELLAADVQLVAAVRESIASSLRVVPDCLIRNCGESKKDVALLLLRYRSSGGSWDVYPGSRVERVYDNFRTKLASLQSAFENAVLLLRIDDILQISSLETGSDTSAAQSSEDRMDDDVSAVQESTYDAAPADMASAQMAENLLPPSVRNRRRNILFRGQVFSASTDDFGKRFVSSAGSPFSSQKPLMKDRES